jgi:hypothetical protein
MKHGGPVKKYPVKCRSCRKIIGFGTIPVLLISADELLGCIFNRIPLGRT